MLAGVAKTASTDDELLFTDATWDLEASVLPKSHIVFPGDPPDRLIDATAVENGWRLVTKDTRPRRRRHPHPVTLW